MVLSLAACGDGGGGGGGGGMIDASTQSDSTMADAAPPDGPTGPRQGIVIVSEADLLGETDASADVVLANGRLFGTPATTVGDCDVYLAEPDEVSHSAGVISITGTTEPLTLTPDGSTPPVNYGAMPDPLPTDLFATGATLTFSAAGGEVPAFSGTVTAPGPIAGAAFPATVSRSTASTVTWTAGTAEGAWVWLLGFDEMGGGEALLFCRTADDGSFDIPPAAVAMFPAAYTVGLTLLWRVNDTEVTAGVWDVALTAATATGAETAIGP